MFSWTKRAAILSMETVSYLLVIIIAVGVATYGFREWIDTGRRNSAKAELSTIASAVSTYKYDMEKYPTDLETLTKKDGNYGPWLAALNKDPWGKEYHLVVNKDKNRFIVYTFANTDGTGTVPNVEDVKSGNTDNTCVYFVGQ